MQCTWITLKPSLPPFVEKLSSMKLALAAKKVGDHWSLGPRHGSNIGWKFVYSYVINEQAEKKKIKGKKDIAPTRQRPYCFMGRQKLGLPLTIAEVSSATALSPLRFKWKTHLSLRPLSFLLMPLMWTDVQCQYHVCRELLPGKSPVYGFNDFVGKFCFPGCDNV